MSHAHCDGSQVIEVVCWPLSFFQLANQAHVFDQDDHALNGVVRLQKGRQGQIDREPGRRSVTHAFRLHIVVAGSGYQDFPDFVEDMRLPGK